MDTTATTISTRAGQLWTLVAAVLALHMLTTPFAVYLELVDHGPTWLGLDDSARMVLSWAWKDHVNWGHDMVYTYGPLSFLSTKVGWGVNPVFFFLCDLFVAFNFFFLFRSFLLQSRRRWLALVVLFLITLITPLFYGSGLAWILTVFVYYWMYRAYEAPRPLHFIMLAVLITIAFYIKLNTGLFTILFLMGYLLLMCLNRRISWLFAGISVGGLAALIGLCALLFNVSLPAYVRGATEVVKGYNDLLYLYQDHPKAEAVIKTLFCVSGIVLCGLAALRLRRRDWTGAALALFCFAYFFLLKKQAIFRNDWQHLEEFFAYAPLLWLCGVTRSIWPRRQEVALGAVLLVSITCLACIKREEHLAPFTLQRLTGRYTVPYRYLREMAAYNPSAYANQSDKRLIPQRILQRIGSATVDVFPWDANYALQNGLHYHPRPCFQTFQANSDYLQRLNYDFYVQRGPQFVIYDYDAIDGAYPFNDAPSLNLLLAQQYSVADTFTSNERWRILLERRPGAALPLQFSEEVTAATAALNVPVDVQQTPFLKLDVAYTLRGKIRAFWSKPSPLQIGYQGENGDWHTCKTSPELLRSGIFTHFMLRDNQQFAQFVNGDTAGLGRIRAIRILGDPDHYRQQISVRSIRLN